MDLLTRIDPGPPLLRSDSNKLQDEDRPAHDWYRFVLSYPPHLVRYYLDVFNAGPQEHVVDPFCGTGTTLVECKKRGQRCTGLEPNPMACFASRVKLNWTADPAALAQHAQMIAAEAQERADFLQAEHRLLTLPHEKMALILTNSISPLPLHKSLCLLQVINEQRLNPLTAYEKLALAKGLVTDIGNLNFGPEVGVGQIRADAPVFERWLQIVQQMARDLVILRTGSATESEVHLADSRSPQRYLEPRSVDVVITSPPYPNEKDYTRTTRLESVVLGFINSAQDLRSLKQDLVRSNTRGVYKSDIDHELIEDVDEIRRVAEEIERRRIEMGKTSGFERLYSRVTKLYFGGIKRHLAELRQVLRPGARLAYVVGDQASYLRVMIRTGNLLSEIARDSEYEVLGIDLFRTRLATATREQLREEVVLLRWRGSRIYVGGAVLKKPNRYTAIIEKSSNPSSNQE